MRKKLFIPISVGIAFFILISQTAAQQEQWLQYHSSREDSQVLGLVGFHTIELSTQQPSDVKLPKFKGKNQLFAKWSTPMVESGYLWIVLDRTHEQGPCDLLYIDSNADGNLDDETTSAAYRTDQSNAYFGPVRVIFQVEDGPVTYHLNFRFSQYGTNDSRFFVSSGGWYEGDITVGGEKKHCVLFDNNVNGAFNDKSGKASDCDRIRIGEQGSKDILFTGKFIDVDKTLYELDIARDGAYIKLTKAENVKYGTVQLPESITQFSAYGENGLFILKPEQGIASLPAGKYSVYGWAIERKDETETNWKLYSFGGTKNTFEITENKQAVLSIGEPVVATLDASEREGTYSFNHSMQGRAGEQIELTRNGAQPQAPKVRITNANGTYDRTYSFQYG